MVGVLDDKGAGVERIPLSSEQQATVPVTDFIMRSVRVRTGANNIPQKGILYEVVGLLEALLK